MASAGSATLIVSNEVSDLIISDAALTIAFTFVFIRNTFTLSSFLYYLPISFVAVTLSFVLHEYMHKIVAQRFGAIAAFKKSDTGLVITLVSSFLGFLIGIPGATMIYTNNFTRREEGLVSLAGPLTNFMIFLVFFGISIFANPYLSSHSYFEEMVSLVMFISVWLAFFNMLPIYPLDGSKVMRWNIEVYAVMLGLTFVFLYLLVGTQLVVSMVFALCIALVFSMLYSGMRLF